MITRLIAAYRRWRAVQDDYNRLIELGSRIVAENRSPETDEERSAVDAYRDWLDAQW